MLEIFQSYSYLGLFVILLIEETGVPLPIPGDIFIATVAALPNSNYFYTVISVVASTLIGSTILFSISKKLGYPLLTKYGHHIKVDKKKVKKIEKWFTNYGGFAIIIGRLIPGLRIVTPFAAGTFNVSYKTFWLYTTIAALIWANIYFIIGKIFIEAFTLLNS